MRSMPQSDAGGNPSRFLAIASIGAVVAVLYFARDVMIPVAVALLLTFLLTPLVHRLEHLRVPRVPAVLLTVGLAFALVAGIGWIISNQATDLAIRVSSYQSDIERKIQNFHRSFGHGALAKASESITQMAQEVATSQPSEPSGSATWAARGTPDNPVSVEIKSAPATSTGFKILGDLLEYVAPMGQSVIVVVFAVFMLIQREDIRDRVIRLMGHGRLSVTTRALDDAATRVSSYLLAQGGLNAVIGIVVAIGLYLIGVPNAPLWGLLCALLRFIPYVGVWIGAIFPIILSFVVPDGSYAARPFLTIGLFVAMEVVAANFIEPVLFGSRTGVSPLAILVAAVFWTWLWGGIGLLLSTPLTVLLAVAGKYVPQLEFLDVLLGDQPVLTPPERYYQRLLAEDPEEAEDLLEEFEKTRSPAELYTQIMLPAMKMMERDHRRGVLDESERNIIFQVMRSQAETLPTSPRHIAAKTDTPPLISRDCTIRILCLPARDAADEIAGMLLVNLLNIQGYCATCAATGILASEVVDSIETSKADLAVVSSSPPGAISHARYLCKKIRARFPEIPLLVGAWNSDDNIERLQKRLSPDPGIRLVTKLEDALDVIHQMVQPLLVKTDEANPTASSRPPSRTVS
jgi:predicted PurR-regulated permease PerM